MGDSNPVHGRVGGFGLPDVVRSGYVERDVPHKRILRMLGRYVKQLFEDRGSARRIAGGLLVHRSFAARDLRHQGDALGQPPGRLVYSRSRWNCLVGLC
jgi:hypothetical protein